MAQVARLPRPRPGEIDEYISYLIREWKAIPKIATQWDDWEEPDRVDFVSEWPIKADRLHLLRHWAKRGVMTAVQCARFDELLAVIGEHQSALDRLLTD